MAEAGVVVLGHGDDGVGHHLGRRGLAVGRERAERHVEAVGHLLVGRAGVEPGGHERVAGELGLELAGLDHREPDVPQAALEVQRLGDGLDRVLRRRVDAGERPGHEAGDRADVDDHAAALLAHDRDHGPHDPQQPEHVGVELHEHLVVAAFLDRPAQLDAGVVDADVDASGPFDDLGDGSLHRVGIAHVEADDVQVEFLLRRRVLERLGPLERAHGGEHLVTLAGEAQRGVVAEPTRASRQQDRRHPAPPLVLSSRPRRPRTPGRNGRYSARFHPTFAEIGCRT